MRFLDQFTPPDAARLLATGKRLQLQQGDHLIRRGETTGDLYLVELGALEVVDTRSEPHVVIDVLGPGAVVGEMAFIDQAPRAADVRATVDTVCRRWPHPELLQNLAEDPPFASAFYRAVATTVVNRVRSVTTTAMAGGLAQRREPPLAGSNQEVKNLALKARTRWFRAETRMAQEGDGGGPRRQVRDALAILANDIGHWSRQAGDPEHLLFGGSVIAKELQPYLARAQTVALLHSRAETASGDLELYNHVLEGPAQGEGAFGHALDQALLTLPTLAALSARREMLLDVTLEAAALTQPRELLAINAAAGGLLPLLVSVIGPLGATLTCLEGTRERLSLAGLGLGGESNLRLVHEGMDRLVFGRTQMHHEPQDIILVDGLLEYLPDRLAATVLDWCHDRLRPGGVLVVSAMGDASDDAFIGHVLGWPMIRRTCEAMVALMSAAGLHKPDCKQETDHPAALVAQGVAGIRGLAREDHRS